MVNTPGLLNFNRASAALRAPGARLMRMESGKGREFFVVPGGRVSDGVAERLIARGDVIAMADGLFPGHSQTWQIVR